MEYRAIYDDEYISHHGVKGMRWGHRKDGGPQGYLGTYPKGVYKAKRKTNNKRTDSEILMDLSTSIGEINVVYTPANKYHKELVTINKPSPNTSKMNYNLYHGDKESYSNDLNTIKTAGALANKIIKNKDEIKIRKAANKAIMNGLSKDTRDDNYVNALKSRIKEDKTPYTIVPVVYPEDQISDFTKPFALWVDMPISENIPYVEAEYNPKDGSFKIWNANLS